MINSYANLKYAVEYLLGVDKHKGKFKDREEKISLFLYKSAAVLSIPGVCHCTIYLEGNMRENPPDEFLRVCVNFEDFDADCDSDVKGTIFCMRAANFNLQDGLTNNETKRTWYNLSGIIYAGRNLISATLAFLSHKYR